MNNIVLGHLDNLAKDHSAMYVSTMLVSSPDLLAS